MSWGDEVVVKGADPDNIEVVARVETLKAEYEDCGTHRFRITLELDGYMAIDLLRALSLQLRNRFGEDSVRRWVKEGMEEE